MVVGSLDSLSVAVLVEIFGTGLLACNFGGKHPEAERPHRRPEMELDLVEGLCGKDGWGRKCSSKSEVRETGVLVKPLCQVPRAFLDQPISTHCFL